MELMKESVVMYETLYADKTQVYVEGDLIVPDVKPDILKILQVDAVSTVTSKEVTDGRLTVSGKVHLTILYIPEQENACMQSIPAVFDFSERIERPGITDSALVSVDTDVERVEFNLIHSRKLSVKSAVGLDCRITCEKETELVTDIDGDAACMRDALTLNHVLLANEEEFMIQERVEVPAGKPSIGEILKADVKICDKEIKPITGKLVAKGTVNLCILYTSDTGEISFMGADIPFTEVFDAENLQEDMDCNLDFEIREFRHEVAEDNDGDLRMLHFELLAAAKINASETRTTEIISDFFCPGCDTELICEDFEFEQTAAHVRTQNVLREVIAVDNKLPQIAGVYNVVTKTVINKVVPESGKITVEGRVEAYVLYLTDNAQSPVYSMKKDIPFSYMLDAPTVRPGMQCRMQADAAQLSYSLNAAGEVELRCMLVLLAEASERKTVHLITDCTVTPRTQKNGIVIYFIQNGDTLWDIAKHYCVSVDDILEFNGLDADDRLRAGTKLIIPAVSAKL